jgi:hypothetical protein
MRVIRTGIVFGVVLILLGAGMHCLFLVFPTMHLSYTSSAMTPEASASDNTTTYYAVICACSRYENPKYNLPKFFPAPESKLRVLYDALLQTSTWEEDHILLLLNQNATKQNILAALETMAGLVGPNDVFLFTWNGHGSEVPDTDGDESVGDPSDTYDEVICPYDVVKTNGTLVNAITDDELSFYFSKIHAKGKCLIFESCLSGGLVDQQKKDRGFGDSTYITTDFSWDTTNPRTMDINGNDTVVMMSTTPWSLGRATFISHSPFLFSLAQSITHSKRYDKNNDGILSAEEAFRVSRPLTFLQSSLIWVPLWVGEYMVYKFDLYKMFSSHPRLIRSYLFLDRIVPFPALLATGILFLMYVYVQLITKSLNGHLMLNWPNMQDDYRGELPLVQL